MNYLKNLDGVVNMGNRNAGIFGGVLSLLAATGLFALWWFVLQPALSVASSYNGLLTLWGLEELGFITTGIPWSNPILGTITLEQLVWIGASVTSMPVTQVNFWGLFQLDFLICVIVLISLIAVGGILGIAGAGED